MIKFLLSLFDMGNKAYQEEQGRLHEPGHAEAAINHSLQNSNTRISVMHDNDRFMAVINSNGDVTRNFHRGLV